MDLPVSTAADDHRQRREEAIVKELAHISKQQEITQEKDLKCLQRLVEAAAENVKRQGKELDERRATRNIFSKSGNGLQKLTSSFSTFLKAYPGISELSKSADSHYGGMVVGALSMLFQVRKFTLFLENVLQLIPQRLARTKRTVRQLSVLLSQSLRDHG